MMRWVLALLLSLASALPLAAQSVRVRSGEHPDFTRLVLEFPKPVDWRLGRSADGYELRLSGATADYDLAQVFDQIGKKRLAAITANAETGALKLSIACGCYAIPFEFRPGTIVIDLRDGVPPAGSSFEEPFADPEPALDLAKQEPPQPPAAREPSPERGEPASSQASSEQAKGPSYDWTLELPGARRPEVSPALALLERNLQTPTKSAEPLETLRQSLIEELGRGATQGIVEMAPPKPGTELAEATDETSGAGSENREPGSVALRLGDAANLEIRRQGEASEPLASSGAACIAQEKLAVVDWADSDPIAEQIGPVLSGLVGEFDRPDTEVVARAVKFYLNLGFGAEAKALLLAFPDGQEDAAIWLSMANLLDGKPDNPSAFAGMAACDTSAALWAVLADPEVLALGQVEKAAVLRAFSALPPHLRQELGPRLVERFLAMKDLDTATTLRDAVLRGRPQATVETEMMEAALERAGGSPAASEARLSELAKDPGTAASDVLTALVIQRAELGQEVSFDQVQALEAFARDHADGAEHDRLQMALTLAYAASGDFSKAFERLPETPEAAPTLWSILARIGRDSPLLEHAVLAESEAPPKEARPVATLIAQRLVTLGLADEAARWLVLEPNPPALLAAKVALGQGDPERALKLIGTDDSPPAEDLRLAAYRAQRDEVAIADQSGKLGLGEAEWAAISRMQDWPRLAKDGPDPWKEASRLLLGTSDSIATDGANTQTGPAQVTPLGPLERDRRLLGDSEATRAAIIALLNGVQAPTPPTQ